MRIGLRRATADALVVNIDDAAGIDGVIRRVEMVATLQLDADSRRCQLVVRGTGDYRRTQTLQGFGVEDAAHGARRENIHVEPVNILWAHRVSAELFHRLLHIGVEDVAHPQLGSGLLEMPGQAQTDMPYALNRYLETSQIVATEALAHGLAQTDEDAQRGGRRRIATGDAAVERSTWRRADDVARALGEGLHFRLAGA